MKKLTIIALLLVASTVFAQQIPRSVVSTSGNSYSATGLEFNYTVGEPMISTYIISGVTMNQGFQQSPKGISCTVDFSFNTDSINVGDTVYFVDSSSAGITARYWTFGEGSYSTEQNPHHVFHKTGIYNVCLSVLDSNTACTADTCKTVEIGSNPCKAYYAYTVTDSVNTISLIDQSEGYNYSLYWTFGDEYTSTINNIDHQYVEAGTYPVGLAIYDSASGCHSYYEKQIKIGTVPCVADFSFFTDPDTRKVTFTDFSTGNLTNWFWDFGDGNYSFTQEPENIYTHTGLYNVSLSAGNNTAECMSRVEKEIQVGTVECKSHFTSYVDSVNNTAYFNSNVSGSSSSLYWEFGDGDFSSEVNCVKQYTKPGYYYVSLSTYDTITQCMDYYSEVILISQVGTDCEAKFSYHTTGQGKVQFKDESKGFNVSGYTWDFGNGQLSTDKNPQYEYLETGYFNVCLTIEDSIYNCRNTTCDYVKVDETKEGCQAVFVYTVDKPSKTIKCIDRSLGEVDAWEWDFGDGTISNDSDPEHTYVNADYYMVHLKVSSSTDNNCRGKNIKVVNIDKANEGLKANFDYDTDTTSGKKGIYPTDFSGASYGEAATFAWSFGDGNSNNTSITPTHQYASPGTYNVCFSVYDANNDLGDTLCDNIIVQAVVGINDRIQSETQVNVYPNPNKGMFTVVCSLSGVETTMVLTNIQGSIIHHQPINQAKTELNISDLPNGIYYLRINTDNEIITRKIVLLK